MEVCIKHFWGILKHNGCLTEKHLYDELQVELATVFKEQHCFTWKNDWQTDKVIPTCIPDKFSQKWAKVCLSLQEFWKTYISHHELDRLSSKETGGGGNKCDYFFFFFYIV